MARKVAAAKISNFLNPDQLLAHINAKFGANTLVRASDALSMQRRHIPTGCVAIDILLGGGLQEGRIHQFRGNFSSGKTTHMLKTAASFLTTYPEAVFVFVDAENASDEAFLKILGFSDDMLTRTFMMYPGCGESAADGCVEAAKMGQKVFVGIDSVDALTPTAELEEDMAKVSMSPGARMMNKFMRKLVPVMATDLLSEDPRCTLVMISQLREKIGVFFGDPSCTWGGKGKEFACSTIIKFARIAWLRDKGDTKSEATTYGMRIQAEMVKCKGPAHGESVEYDYYKRNHDTHSIGDFDNDDALLSWGVRLRVIEKAARSLKYRKIEAVGDKAFAEKLAKMPKTAASLLADIIAARTLLYTKA